MEEIAPGLWHWTARHPRIGINVSSYFVPEHGLLLDPLIPPEGIERLEDLARPREVLLTNRHHWRDCGKLIDRFGCTVRAPRVGMDEFDEGQPVTPYDPGESPVGGAVTVHEVGVLCPDESALHVPSVSALAVADGVVHYGELAFVSDDLMDDPEDTKVGLKEGLRPARGRARVREPPDRPRAAGCRRRPRGVAGLGDQPALAPGRVSHVRHQAQLPLLGVLVDRVAVGHGGEAALGREPEPLARDEAGGLVDPRP